MLVCGNWRGRASKNAAHYIRVKTHTKIKMFEESIASKDAGKKPWNAHKLKTFPNVSNRKYLSKNVKKYMSINRAINSRKKEIMKYTQYIC